MSLEIVRLLTEYEEKPHGIDARHPRLCWIMESENRSSMQTAYRVLVSSCRQSLDRDEADMWDSGRVESDRSVHVRYEGKPLESGKCYFWKVRVWDKDGIPSPWSKHTYWSMGLLDPGEWRAKWIGMNGELTDNYPSAAYLRKTFVIPKPVKKAIVYATALGLYELYFGGRRVGDDHFAPGWTDYGRKVQYQTYDVTEYAEQGETAVAAILATGWYCGKLAMIGKRKYGDRPYLLVQTHIEYEDGSEDLVITDETWKTSEGALIYSEIYRGETYDARREHDGWLLPGFVDSDWQPPIVLPGYGGNLVSQADQPIRITRLIKPVSVTKTESGTYIFDMGQNMAGRVRLKVNGERGARIVLEHAEMLNVDGTLYKTNLRSAVTADTYILNGKGTEIYEPRFTYHGFRYVEMSGFPGEPDLETITGVVLHTDAPLSGKFETDHPLLNRLHSNILWGQRGNFFSIPTDCPQRDERLGWTGDVQVFCRTGCFNMNAARFYAKYAADMVDAQLPSGSFPDVAPDGGYHQRRLNKRKNTDWTPPYSAGWADAGMIIPWTIYQVYGDTEVLERHYAAMIRYMNFLEGVSEQFLVRDIYANNYGDWLALGPETPKKLISTAFYFYSTVLMGRIASVLGHAEDAETYRVRAERIKEAFVREFVALDGKVQGDTQTGYAITLELGLLPEPLAKQAARQLVRVIRQCGNHPTSGFIGIGFLLPALSDYGYSDTAYDLLLQETFPSWFYQIKHGATTIWERWDGWTEENGIHASRMNSFNHYAFGAVGEWLYRYMAGIDTDPGQPGFKHIRIQPHPGIGVSKVHAEYDSLYGKIVSSWQLQDGRFRLQVNIPVNTTATIRMPDQSAHAVGSGQYELEALLPVPAAGTNSSDQEEEIIT
ncbi:glycoside hydrolase family 78 protein [Paenibacillus alkalitolerans]|uniref:glycoside hydrolase family 78 protein n=1 Tax=Paenibacillus alkalitolerans TaxID=2799335 RepID=UPI002D7FCAD8|nr:glycoside hydrolase family 78 protein [Paenibacillus alkalitolerans]